MDRLTTKYFGELEYNESVVFHFPAGIPGFEDQDRFLFVDQARNRPLVFMQSIKTPDLCFIAVPVFVVDPEYRLEVCPEDLAAIDLPLDHAPHIGQDVLCLGLVNVSKYAGPTVNLAAPIVVNLEARKGLQAIRPTGDYSYEHPLLPNEEMAPCS